MTTTAAAADVARFGELVARRLGLRVSDRPGYPLAAVLGDRAHARGTTMGRYLDWLAAGPPDGELAELAASLTVPETYFFRDPAQLRAFMEVALPERLRCLGGSRGPRILSAGCASGEEPYSLAMLLCDAAVSDFSIVGVDVNPEVVAHAVRGRYSGWAMRATPAETRRRWFRADGTDSVLAERIRASVRFETRNLAGPDEELWLPETYDVVFCRNVLMYFAEDQARALAARLVRALAPGGFLFLGVAENGYAHDPGLRLRHGNGCFYFQRGRPSAVGSRRVTRARPPTEPLPGHPPARPAEPSPAHLPARPAEPSPAHLPARAAEPSPNRPSSTPPRPAAAEPSPDRHALELLRSERYAEALAVVLALPDSQRTSPDTLVLEAVLRAAGGDFAGGERVGGTALDLDRCDADAHFVIATCREGVADLDGADEAIQRAVDLDPGFAIPRLHRGILAARRGDRSAAQRDLTRALMLLPWESATRLLLFGGGFGAEGLAALCRSQLSACGGVRDDER